ADEASERHVEPLSGCAIDHPGLLAAAMREVPDEPVPGDAHGDTHANAPHDPRPSAHRVEQERQRQLLPHPGAFDERIETVIREPRFEPEYRRMLEFEPAVQL